MTMNGHEKKGSRKVIFFSLILLLLTAGIGIYFWMKSKPPKYNGVLTFGAIKSKVEVHTDSYGVPHIFAENKDDLYFALGYVQARERLFQMQLMQRLAAGRISELIGEKGLKVDKLFRTLGFHRNAKKWIKENYSKIPKDAHSNIEKYLEGVNTFIAEGNLPAESIILGLKPEPIQKEDVLAFVAFMGFSFAEAMHTDPVISSLESEFGTSMVGEITSQVSTITANVSMDESKKFAVETSRTMNEFKDLIFDLGIPLFQGSNSWVIAPAKSKSGKAMLSNDPHIVFSNPSIWFEAYLHTKDFELYGHFLPMVPFATIGFNSKFAWGLTMFENDDMDFYKENISTADPNKYIYKGKEEDFEIIKEEIKIRGGSPELLVIKVSNHGPIINGLDKSLSDIKYPVSVKWEMFESTNNPITAFYGFNNTKNLKDFENAGETLKIPGLNVVYADKSGNIAHFALGGIHDNNFNGDRILDGSSGNFEWGKLIPYTQQPRKINPPSGIIFTANHKHFGALPYKLNGYWQADDRTSRLTTLLSAKPKYNIDDMKQIVLDDYFDSADYILPILFSEIGCYEASLLPEEKKALELLKKWDRRGKVNESGAAIFSEFRVSLATEIFLDEMGADRFKSIADTSRIHHYLKKVTNNPNSKWWDDRKTQTVETRKEIIYRSFIATVAILLGKQGTNLQEWKWGNMHTLTLKHPLGEVPPLNHLFNSGPRVANGGTETVNNMLARLSNNNHAVIAGPSMRTLIDFMDTEHIQIINPLGQSAHRFSPHFQDQADMFVQGKFRILNLSEMKTKDESRILSMLPK